MSDAELLETTVKAVVQIKKMMDEFYQARVCDQQEIATLRVRVATLEGACQHIAGKSNLFLQ